MIKEEEIEIHVSSGKEDSKEDKETVAIKTDDAQNNGASIVGDNVDVNMQYAKRVVGTATAATSGVKK
jgi:hypothetical protein